MTKIHPRVTDISHHNYDDHGPYDFNAAKKWGLWGVIAKATEDTDYIDDTYTMAREGARKAGLLFGAYHFFRPGNVERQVEHFLNVAWADDPKRDTLLLCLDHEDSGCSVGDVKKFLQIVEDVTGQRPVLYSGHLIKDQLGAKEDDYLGATRLWLAQYGDEPEVQESWDTFWLWQYTGDGDGPSPHDIPGIGTCVDINSWQGSKLELEDEWAERVERPDMPSKPDRPEKPETGGVPTWLAAMRAITGLTETPGSADNPKIMFMADYIAKKYPEQASYAANYTGDDVAWCGLTVGFVMAVSDIEPVFGPTDTDRWMWAQAWGGKYWAAQKISKPQLGCVAVMSREGGGHVCLVEAWEEGSNTFISGGQFKGRGGNQSDMVNVSTQSVSNVIAWMWPSGRHPMVPTLSLDSIETTWVQSSLNLVDKAGLDVDGEMGPATKKAISNFQGDHGLPISGLATEATVAEIIKELEKWNED